MLWAFLIPDNYFKEKSEKESRKSNLSLLWDSPITKTMWMVFIQTYLSHYQEECSWCEITNLLPHTLLSKVLDQASLIVSVHGEFVNLLKEYKSVCRPAESNLIDLSNLSDLSPHSEHVSHNQDPSFSVGTKEILKKAEFLMFGNNIYTHAYNKISQPSKSKDGRIKSQTRDEILYLKEYIGTMLFKTILSSANGFVAIWKEIHKIDSGGIIGDSTTTILQAKERFQSIRESGNLTTPWDYIQF